MYYGSKGITKRSRECGSAVKRRRERRDQSCQSHSPVSLFCQAKAARAREELGLVGEANWGIILHLGGGIHVSFKGNQEARLNRTRRTRAQMVFKRQGPHAHG